MCPHKEGVRIIEVYAQDIKELSAYKRCPLKRSVRLKEVPA